MARALARLSGRPRQGHHRVVDRDGPRDLLVAERDLDQVWISESLRPPAPATPRGRQQARHRARPRHAMRTPVRRASWPPSAVVWHERRPGRTCSRSSGTALLPFSLRDEALGRRQDDGSANRSLASRAALPIRHRGAGAVRHGDHIKCGSCGRSTRFARRPVTPGDRGRGADEGRLVQNSAVHRRPSSPTRAAARPRRQRHRHRRGLRDLSSRSRTRPRQGPV